MFNKLCWLYWKVLTKINKRDSEIDLETGYERNIEGFIRRQVREDSSYSLMMHRVTSSQPDVRMTPVVEDPP